jgi:hypothetical protein
MKRTWGIAVVVGLGLVLTGCGEGSDKASTTTTPEPPDTADTVTVDPSAPGDNPTPAPSDAEESSDIASDDEIEADIAANSGAWGQAQQWSDGIEVTVSQPQPHDISRYEGVVDLETFPEGITYDVTITNTTDAPLELTLAGSSSVYSGTADGELLICESDVSRPVTLQPGRTAQWPECWAVQDGSDTIVMVGHSLDEVHYPLVWGLS